MNHYPKNVSEDTESVISSSFCTYNARMDKYYQMVPSLSDWNGIYN